MTNDDMGLVREYAAHRSESAFAALVSRHANLVYSAALRRTGDAQLSEEVTQAVFIILARKAGSLGPKTILASWLYRAACYVSSSALKQEIRRRNREQEAYMQSHLPDQDTTWAQLSPLLEDAMLDLGQTDRDALVLRFFEGRSLHEVGTALGANEDAAKKRVSRAVEKLRRYFAKRGVVVPAVVLMGALSAHTVHAAPQALAKSVTAIAAAKGAASSGTSLILIKGALKLMAWSKVKVAVVVGIGLLVAGGTTTLAVKKFAHPQLSTTDLSWADDPKYWVMNSGVLEKNPPVLILRPTKFPNQSGSIQVGDSGGKKLLFKNATLRTMIASAYGANEVRTVMPDGSPDARYDLMLTLRDPGGKLLQEKLKSEFGLTAHFEEKSKEVVYLRVANTHAPGLIVSHGGGQYWSGRSSGNLTEQTMTNVPWGNMLGFFENRLGKPTIDETDLKGGYDVHLKWKSNDRESELDNFTQALRDQLGVEVVPGNESVKILVVEKVP